MKPTYITNVMSSFYLWLDHELAKIGQAYTVSSGNLYQVPDYNFNGYNAYSSPYRQWISDSDPQIGATVPSGVYINGSFVPADGTGVVINYNFGEVLVNPALGVVNQISSQYSYKDFNLYYTDEKEENLLFENSTAIASKFINMTGGLSPDDQPFPCIYLKNTYHENQSYALGGEDKSITRIRCMILADNMYILDGAISIMSDAVRKVFPILDSTTLPFNYFGGFKTGNSYQYSQLPDVISGNNIAYIDKVKVSRLEEMRNKHISLKVVVALVDFDIWQARYPRVYSA